MPYYVCDENTGEIICKQADRADERTEDTSPSGYFRIKATTDLDMSMLHRFIGKPDGRIQTKPAQDINALEEEQAWFQVRVDRRIWFDQFDPAYDHAQKDKDSSKINRLLKIRKRAKDVTDNHTTPEAAAAEIEALYEEL